MSCRAPGASASAFPEADLPLRGPRATGYVTVGTLGRAEEPGAHGLGRRERKAIWGGVRPV